MVRLHFRKFKRPRLHYAARTALVQAVAILLSGAHARANIAENTGFGSRTAALGGAGVAWGSGPYAAYSNPAVLASDPNREPLQFSWGLMYKSPSLTPIRDVVVENRFVSDQTRTGEVSTDYRNTFGQSIGLSYRLSSGEARWSLGVAAFLPIESLAFVDTGEIYIPEYFQLRARTQRPQVAFSLARALSDRWSVGAGVALSYTLTGNSSVFLNTNAGAQPSTMRISASIKPRALPFLGLIYSRPGVSAGLVVRAPTSSLAEFTLNTSARAFGNLAALDFNFKANSALYYDPLSIELGGAVDAWADSKLVVQLEYQRWSAFTPPTLNIQSPTTTECSNGAPCGVIINSSQNPSFKFADTWVPRVGIEKAWATDVFRAGYFYRPGIVSKDQLEGAGNALDPSRHALSIGFGHRFRRFLHLETPCQLDLFAQYEALISQQITKSAGNEAGTAADQKIGAPGYTAGGKIMGGGLTLSFLL